MGWRPKLWDIIQTALTVDGKIRVEAGSTTEPAVVQQSSKSSYSTGALDSSDVIKASAGKIYGAFGVNDSASEITLQFFDLAAVPADTAVPDLIFKIPAKSNFGLDFGIYGFSMANGIVWAASTTLTTKTEDGNVVWLNATYE